MKIGMCAPVTGPAAESGKYAQIGARHRARRGQQGGRRARQAGRADRRGRPDHQSRHRPRVLEARLADRHRRLPRLDPLDAGARDGARRAEDRQAGDDRRHRPGAHAHGQPVAVPLPPERLLLGQRDRRVRRQDARQEEMGDRPFDRRLRHRRRQGADDGARQDRRHDASRSTRATPTRARTSRRSCSRSSSRAPTSSAPTSPSRTTSACSRASCASSASTSPTSGSPSIVNVTALKLAGPALYGTFGVADYAEDSSEASKAFGKLYRDVAKVAPDNQSSWTYDAITVLCMAIKKAGKTDPTAIREAILSIKKHPGRRRRIQLRRQRRRPARLQHRAQREGHDRLRQAHRVDLLSEVDAPAAGFCGPGPARSAMRL